MDKLQTIIGEMYSKDIDVIEGEQKLRALMTTVHWNACFETITVCSEQWDVKDKMHPAHPEINMVKRT